MIHAKTLVADGWLSKVGSTNLNFQPGRQLGDRSGVEDTDFASQMEELFRGRRLQKQGGPTGRVRTTPEGPARSPGGHHRQRCAPVSSAAARDLGGPLQGWHHRLPEGHPPADPRARHRRRRERRPARGVSARRPFPRLIAWHAAVGAFGGAVVRDPIDASNREPDRPESGRSEGWKIWNRTKI